MENADMNADAEYWEDFASLPEAPIEYSQNAYPAPISLTLRPHPAPVECTQEEPLFVAPEPRVPRRAHNLDGLPFATTCFEGPHAALPHHHRLRCGHDVQTEDVQRCGSNCDPSMMAESKIQEVPFLCPSKACANERRQEAKKPKMFIQRASKQLALRKCALSHVYGIDEEADARQRLQQANATAKEPETIDLTSEDRRYRTRDQSKTSRSADRSRSPGSARRSTRQSKRKAPPDENEIIKELAGSEKGYRVLMELTGPGVREKFNGRLKTKEENEVDVLNAKTAHALRQFGDLGTASKEEIRTKVQEARRQKVGAQQNFAEADLPIGGQEAEKPEPQGLDLEARCNRCEEWIFDVRYHCFECGHPGFNLCHDCYQRDSVHEPGHHLYETFKAIETYCKCKDTSTEFLVPCSTCSTQFHPGCFGLGRWFEHAYNIDEVSMTKRRNALRADHRRWKESLKNPFQCQACLGAKAAFEDGLKKNREQKDRDAEYYKPQQTVEKRKRLAKAKTDEDRAAIETEYQEEDGGDAEDDGGEEILSEMPDCQAGTKEAADSNGVEQAPFRRSQRLSVGILIAGEEIDVDSA